MHVAISAVSSYSGMCIAEAFAHAGATVTGTLTQAVTSYSGRRKVRLERAAFAGVELVPHLDAESGSLAAFLSTRRFDVWIHHHHPMQDFRSAAYDLASCRKAAIAPLASLADAWRAAGVRGVIYSGTYFEPGEGGRSVDATATPYARLKAEVSENLAQLCAERNMAESKIVITTPTGALENEDRLTPQLLLCGLEGRPFSLNSPESIFDSIPGETLGQVYVQAAEEMLSGGAEGKVHRPSGWRASARDWTQWVQQSLARPLGLEIDVRVPEESARSPVAQFFNPPEEQMPIDWDAVARRYVDDWRAHYPFR